MIVKDQLRILTFLLVVLGCGLAALATESPARTQISGPSLAQINLLQIGTQLQTTSFDCSHLVHSLYGRVGLHYHYATSRTLYQGIEEFQRVLEPMSGDVIVWRGHMGIVVDPAKHSFLSALKTRVKTSSYTSGYWKHRGPPRFFRFGSIAETPNQ
jgi:cell wall-associated NlpC family hydrolase